MNKATTFIRKHLAAVLVVAIALAVPVGMASAKYTTTVNAASGISVSVDMSYTINSSSLKTALNAISKPTSIKVVTGSDVPTGAVYQASVGSTSGFRVGVFLDESDVYIAPMKSDSDAPDTSVTEKIYVDDCTKLFQNKSSLQSVNLTNLDTSRVTSMNSMFGGCYGLTSIDFGSSFNTSNVDDMNGMFYSCLKLQSLNLSSFDTAKVTKMQSMFYECTALESLDIRTFNTSNVTTMNYMFFKCSVLESITVGSDFTTASVTASANMFGGCTSLVGGDGTLFDSTKIDKTYARIDTASTPGYFTAAS